MTPAEREVILANNRLARAYKRPVRRHLYVPVSNTITCRNIAVTSRDPRTDTSIRPTRKALR